MAEESGRFRPIGKNLQPWNPVTMLSASPQEFRDIPTESMTMKNLRMILVAAIAGLMVLAMSGTAYAQG